MTPGELAEIEDTLRRAYSDVVDAVRQHEAAEPALVNFVPGRSSGGAGRPGGRPRWLVPAAAGAAVAVIAVIAGLVVPGAIRQAPPVALVPRHMGYVVADHAVIPVNLTTGVALRPIRFAVHGGPAGQIMTPDGRTIYVVTYQGYVVPVSTVTRTAGPPIRIGGGPQGVLMSPDGHTAYIIEPPYGVEIFNLTLNQPAGFIRIHDAQGFALTPNGKTLYVVNSTGSAITPVETATLTLLPPIKTRSDANGFQYIAVAPDGKTIYATGQVNNGVSLTGATSVLTPIRTATNTALPPLTVGHASYWAGPLSISPDSRTAYVPSRAGVTAISLTSRAVTWTARLPVAAFSYDMEVSPDGQTIYAMGLSLDSDLVTLYRIRAATGALLGPPIRTGQSVGMLGELDVSPDGTTVYVQAQPLGPARFTVGTMATVNAATGRVGRPIRLPFLSKLTSGLGSLLFGPS